MGLLFVIIVGSFIAFDYILLPRFGKEIGAGLGISFSTDIEIGNYQSILGAFLNKILSPKHIRLLNSYYSLVTLIVLPILAGGIIYEFLGKWADKRRTKDFSQEAFSFLFGKEALDQLLAEYKSIEEEKAFEQSPIFRNFDEHRFSELERAIVSSKATYIRHIEGRGLHLINQYDIVCRDGEWRIIRQVIEALPTAD